MYGADGSRQPYLLALNQPKFGDQMVPFDFKIVEIGLQRGDFRRWSTVTLGLGQIFPPVRLRTVMR